LNSNALLPIQNEGIQRLSLSFTGYANWRPSDRPSESVRAILAKRGVTVPMAVVRRAWIEESPKGTGT